MPFRMELMPAELEAGVVVALHFDCFSPGFFDRNWDNLLSCCLARQTLRLV